jgi:AbrB family looped-hinge helix DNA binding protein
MESVIVSAKGRIAIPKPVRDSLNLAEGTKLTLEVRGQQLILSKQPAWKNLHGAAAGQDLIGAFAKFKKHERKGESARP